MRWGLRAPLRVPRLAGTLAAAGDVGLQLSQAMRFPSNVGNGTPPGNTPLAVLRYDDPHLDGLPFLGASGAGALYIFEVKTRAQTGYYVNFWNGPGDGHFYADADDVPYVGGHLYPTSQDNNGTSHEYELAIKAGDFRTTQAGTAQAAEHGVWRKQAVRVGVVDSNVNVRYYLNLPSTDSVDIIARTEVDYGMTLREGLSRVLMIGDSPWYLDYQHECLSGSLRAMKIFNQPLTLITMFQEAADMSQVVTAGGLSAVWWMKPGFTSLDDLTCPYTGRTFTRDDSGGLLTLENV